MKKELKASPRTLTVLSIFAEQKAHRIERNELAVLILERLKDNAQRIGTDEKIPNILEIAILLDDIIRDETYFENDDWDISPTLEGIKAGEMWLRKVYEARDR